ncbi:dTDP-4-dehydrorhamnose reductase [Thermococcus sp. 21S7]|uniref:dTDP-4-dehydrorhamnose reductase n=1 Tax=Thermococcus sp. 21S7 TaxID=1638221 RepID=UPI00143C4E3F|nr:dTDP-4-dehydrorhamnose reductase [Thermococcus sp. 21S7]NJE62108.1 dTDP-4-dehydrorhamnose reductase [Thermococcus sp. 21S7]
MRVAVIGANGQLGSDLVRAFGENAVPLTHRDLDVTDIESLDILKELRPDVIINTAAYHKTDECEENPEKTFLVNSVGARNVATVAKDINAINVYISTDYVFDGEKGRPYTEDDVPNPINVYGVSKYAGELLTRYIHGEHYVIRVSSLFGIAGASGKGGNFVETMIKLAKSGRELNVVNDVIMSPTYTKDAALAIKAILENGLPYGTYHVTNGGFCSWYEFAKAIFEITGIGANLNPITSDEFPTKAKRPKFSALSVEKLKSHGINMRPWRNALEDYLREKGHIQ